jgi:hypothetical protein
MAFRRLNGCHVIAAYILIETEAGKAAAVAAALRDLPGVPETAVLAGPLRRHRPGPGTQRRRAGPAGHLPDPGPRWRATDDDLPVVHL